MFFYGLADNKNCFFRTTIEKKLSVYIRNVFIIFTDVTAKTIFLGYVLPKWVA